MTSIAQPVIGLEAFETAAALLQIVKSRDYGECAMPMVACRCS